MTAQDVVDDILNMIKEKEEEYFRLRKNTDDFEDKNIYSEGEAALSGIRWRIRKKYGKVDIKSKSL